MLVPARGPGQHPVLACSPVIREVRQPGPVVRGQCLGPVVILAIPVDPTAVVKADADRLARIMEGAKQAGAISGEGPTQVSEEERSRLHNALLEFIEPVQHLTTEDLPTLLGR
jgi:hypothetical protein